MIDLIIKKYDTIGFSGTRNTAGKIPSQILSNTAIVVNKNTKILLGCQKGIDAYFRQFFPKAEVFAVSSGRWGSGPGAYAARSIACVDACRLASGLWVSFPGDHCPPGLVPHRSSSKCFSGTKSGSWASLAYAIGSGCPALCYGFDPKWGELKKLDSGWLYFEPTAKQLSLF